MTPTESGTDVLGSVAPPAWERLATRRVFFGHKSVGRNVMAGVRRVVEARPDLGVRLVTTDDPSSVDGPALMDAEIGENRHPGTKDRAFADVLDAGFGEEAGSVALYKYCYVDMRPGADPEELFESYSSHVDALKDRHPHLIFAHVTMPLCRARGGWKEWLKIRLGRTTQTVLNYARNRYNELLRMRYGGVDPVFDLAHLESVRRDGTRAHTRHRGRDVYMLAPEWTYDGGHLNEEARERFGERFLAFLAGIERPENAEATGS